ncbi:MAG: immunity 8 family protein [Chloroflexota bacterium]
MPELRGLHSPDLWDMEHDAPADPTDFCILVQVFVGPSGEAGEESFDFLVCTPRWLIRHVEENGPLFARHHLVINRYDYEAIYHAIDSLCQDLVAATWGEVGERLGRYGRWEFEDYHELQPAPPDGQFATSGGPQRLQSGA